MKEGQQAVGLLCSDARLVEYYVRLITKIQRFQLKAIWCPDAERSIQLAADNDVPSVSHTAYQLISRADTQAVIIAGHPTHNALFCVQAQGVPKVSCEENDLALDIITAQPFLGNIFVKGHSKNAECRRSFAINNTNSYALSLGNCGMQRLRSVNPRGINFVVTLIVSFHPNGFITKNDRAFHLKCFYIERSEILTAAIKVSELTPSVLSHEPVMPTCKYSVKRGSVNGQEIKFANVGETVFHVWECSGGEMGMLVKKCFVTDGEGEQHAVVDLNGCSTDNSLLNELTYDASTMRAHAQSHVFKYADSNQLYFTCQVQLCQKILGLCYGITPPNCADRKGNRERRQSVDAKLINDERLELDLVSPQMLIADVDEDATQIDVQHSSNMNLLCTSQILIALLPFCVLTAIAIVCSIVKIICDKYSSSAKPTKSSSSSFFCISSCKPYPPA